MSINAGTIMAYLDMDTTGFNRAFDTAASQLSGFTDGGIEGALGSIGAAATTAGRAMSIGVTTPLLGIATAAVSTGKEFDAQMSRVQAIAGATDEEFKALRQTAIDLGASTTFSGLEAAEGMENLASAGFSTNEIIAAMPGMLDLAAASGESLATSAGIAASTLRGFGLNADQAGHVADVLAENAARTNAAVYDTGESMKYVAPMANAMGLSLEEVTAAIGIMSDAGIMGGQAGTTLRGALSRLAKPTEDMSEVMQKLGLDFYDSGGNMKSLESIIGMLDTKMAGLTNEQKQNALVTLFGQEALSGIMVLMEAGSDKLGDLTNAYKDCDGAAADMAKTMTDNLQGDIEGFGGAMESAALSLSDFLTPALRDVVQFATGVVDGFNGLAQPVKDAIFQFGAVAAAIGPVLLVGGKLVTFLSTLTSPLGLVAGGFALAYEHSSTLQGAVATLGEGFSAFFTALEGNSGILDALKTGLTTMIGEDAVASIGTFLTNVQSGVELIGSAFGTITSGIGEFIGSLIDGEGLVGAWNSATATISAFDWAGIGTSIQTGVTGVFDAAGEWLGGHFTTALTAAQNTDWAALGASIHAGAVEKLDAAGAWLSGLFEAGKTAAGNVPWGEIGTAIWNGITGVIDAAGNFLSGLFTGGKDAAVNIPWDEIGTTILGGVTGVLDTAGTFLSGIFTAGKDAAALVPWDEIGTSIQTGVNGVIDAGGTFLSGAFQAAKTTIEGIQWGDVGSKINSGLSGALDTLGKIGGSIWDTITGWFSDDDEESAQADAEAMMDGLETGITGGAGAVAAAASSAASGVSTAMTNVLNLEGGTVIAASWMNGLSAGITAAQATLTTNAQTVTDATKLVMDTTFSATNGTTIGTVFMAGISFGFTTTSSTLNTNVTTAASAAMLAASGVLNFIAGSSIGKDMVLGMAAGVRSGSGTLNSAIRSVASSAVAAARSALKINSPSGVFEDEVGAWIPSGVGVGVTKNMQDALGPIEEMREGMVSMMDGTLSGVSLGRPKAPWEGGSGYAGQNTVNINVTGDWTVRSDEDRDEIINELYERISEELRRR